MAQIIRKLGELNRALNKKEIVKLAKDNAAEIIASKQYDLLKVYIELKRYEVYLKTIMAAVKRQTCERAAELKKESTPTSLKSFEYDDAKVAITSRAIYDFSQDPEWLSLTRQIEELVAKLKAREKYLKAHGYTSVTVDEETGEVIETSSILKEVKSGLNIRL